MAADPPTDLRLTDTQRRVLAALCRPIAEGTSTVPATDQEIAGAVFLSVDAVQGHLRTLYRKYGIEGLPEDRKRARLAELAIAGGPAEPAPVPKTLAAEEAEGKEGRSIGPYITIAILILVIIGASLVTSGIFNQGSNAQRAPTPAAFRREVGDYCRQAVSDAQRTSYREAIVTLRGQFESLVQPTLPDISLEHFGSGLRTAAGTMTAFQEGSKGPSGAEARAELKAAADQIRSGARGYKLGPECVAVGDLVARVGGTYISS